MRNQMGAVSPETPYLRGDRVPSTTMTAYPGGERFGLRPSRGPRVFVSLHSTECEECIDYARKIAAVREPVEAWGADLVIVSGDVSRSAETFLPQLDITVIDDPDRVICRGRLEVIIADEWGEIHFANEGKGAHNPLPPEEVVEWAKFVAIQCPECEGPEGEWKNL